MPQISLSLLSADFMHLEDDLKRMEPYVDRLHFDVMDGHFVDNIALGLPLLQELKSTRPIDAHLMITNPEDFIEDFAKYADAIYIHWEMARDNAPELIAKIKACGKTPGITLNPATPAEEIFHLLPMINNVLIMSVIPGHGGQACITSAFDKIPELKKQKPQLIVSVDGGINDETGKLARAKGADILISGSYLFKAENIQKTVERLKG